MTDEPCLDPYLEALREDLPSDRDLTRLQRRLVGAGVGVSLALASKTAVAQSTALAKLGFFSGLSTRFMSLPLMAQLGVVTATTTVVATAPVWGVMQHYDSIRQGQAERVSPAPQRSRSTAAPLDGVASRGDPAQTEAVVPAPPTPRSLVGSAQIASRFEPRASDPTSSEPSTLAEETRLLDDALAAIRRGDLARAERLIAEHEALFPAARLARERQRVKEKLTEARRRSAE